eukprot:6523200-Prymnesium_polylepis.2
MLREDVELARDKFTNNAEPVHIELVNRAIRDYTGQGLIPIDKLRTGDWLEDPSVLLEIVRKTIKDTPEGRLKLIREIMLAWMEVCVENGKLPITPHHT